MTPNPEKPSITSLSQNQPKKYSADDLSNEDIIVKILESGSGQDMKQLQEKANLTPEQMELFRFFAQQRQEVIQQIRQEVENRKQKNPQATDEELAMGSYFESIEPQVRDAVRVFRQKGYSTAGSGYWGPEGSQSVYFGASVDDLSLPENIQEKLKPFNLELIVDHKKIAFTPKEKMDLDQLKIIWDKIATALPDLGHKAEPSPTNQAKMFRKRQNEIK